MSTSAQLPGSVSGPTLSAKARWRRRREKSLSRGHRSSTLLLGRRCQKRVGIGRGVAGLRCSAQPLSPSSGWARWLRQFGQQGPVPSPTASVGSSGMADSSPSRNWFRVPHDEGVFGGSAMRDVTVGGPGLVAVGATAGVEGPSAGATADTVAVVWTSTDGITWSRVPHDEAIFGGAVMHSVVAYGDGLVVVGFDASRDLDAVVWTSTDGITWARLANDETVFGGAEMWDVAVGGPGLVAVGSGDSGPAAWTSTDGITWSRVVDDEAGVEAAGSGMFRVTVGGPGLVAVGWDMGVNRVDAAVWTSTDGIRWSRVEDAEKVFDQSALFGVAAREEGLLAVGEVVSGGNSVAAAWTSADGMNWSRVPHDEAVFGGGVMLDVTTVGPSLVVVGERGSGTAVWTSLDGIHWSRVVDNEAVSGRSALWSVTATDAGLVAVGWDLSRGNSDAAVWGN